MSKYQVTSLSPFRRHKGWHEITLSGQAPFIVDEETIYRYSLKEDLEVSETDFKSIKDAADLAFLKDKGMKIISRRMISERDLRRKLAAERKPPDIRDKAVESLLKYGFIDDFKYAAAYIRSQIAQGPKSKLYLKKKLYQKGISPEISDKAIAEELEGYDFKESVRELAKKKYKTLKNLPPQKAKTRLINFLKSRGFGWEVIKYAITDLMVDEMMNDPGDID
jgi:regulatory protein